MFGYEYIADCGDCDYDKLHSIENIQEFIDELCERTCMKKMGPLHSHYLEDNVFNWLICIGCFFRVFKYMHIGDNTF